MLCCLCNIGGTDDPSNLIELTIEEVPVDKDNEVKNWRIQLDVKTSLKNLKKIEVFIKENIQEML